MKKIFIYSIVSLFVFSTFCVGAYSANSNQEESLTKEIKSNNGQGVQVQVQAQVQTQVGNDGEGVIAQPIKAKTVAELKQIIINMEEDIGAEAEETIIQEAEIREIEEDVSKKIKGALKNQNKVRVAVHALLASKDLVGGIGQEVSEVAREFNNSVQVTILAEEKIHSRSKFVRFFVGGDEEAGHEIEQEVNQNRGRIRNLNQLMKQSECDEEVRNIIQEQIRNIEQEQIRLDELAISEKAKKGLFGWFKNIFRFGK